ncbi:MAG: ATP-binding protein [Myxococcota bacterium]|nr:ATP-binding protein [Myxococcota bacterium]
MPAAAPPASPVRRRTAFERFTLGASAFAIGVGLLVLVGWYLQIDSLTSVFSSLVPMMPNTALALVAAGASLALLGPPQSGPLRRSAGQSLALGLGLLGALTLYEYLAHRDLGLDLVLLPQTREALAQGGRPSFNAAADLVLLSLALLWLDHPGWRARASQYLAIAVGLTAVVALSGYASGVQPFYGIPDRLAYSGLALHTSLALLVLSGGILCARPQRGLMAVVVSTYSGGYMARRMLLAAALFPVLALLVGLGAQLRLYSPALGASLLGGLGMVLAMALVLQVGHRLNTADAEQRRTTLALERLESDQRTLMEHAPEGILVANLEEHFTEVNEAGARMLGYSREELLKLTIQDLLRPEDLPRLRDWKEQLLGGTPLMGEWKIRRKDRTLIPVEVTSRILPDGRWQGFVRDNTERKRLADQQRFLSELSRLLSESLDVQVTIENFARRAVPEIADWCVVDVAQQGEVRRAAVVHRDPARQHLADRLLALTPAPVHMPQGVGEALATQAPILLKDLTPRWLEERAPSPEHFGILMALGARSYLILPLRARGVSLGSLTFVAADRNYTQQDLAFGEEVAGRAALAADNALLYQRAQAAVQTREDVLAVVSHDLKTPINAIRLSSDLIARKLLPQLSGPPQVREALAHKTKTIARASERANRLISDLLDFAKLESGNFRVAVAPEPVAGLMEETAELFGPVAEEQTVDLQVRWPEGLFALCDRARVVQVLGNLVTNAIKFNQPGGRVWMRAAPGPGGEVLFSVRDDGPGIAPDDAAHIFERYWQPEATRRQGTGLGLAIAQGLVEAQGGRIWLQSQVGEGSTFFFTLPAAQGAVETTPRYDA